MALAPCFYWKLSLKSLEKVKLISILGKFAKINPIKVTKNIENLFNREV